jgi:putative SOS response-associated peptidase YedK
MCGRYVSPAQAAIEREWEVGRKSNPDPFRQRYNVAPTQQVPVLRRAADADVLELAAARWGLVPHWWSKPKPPAFSTINARSEEAAAKPFWREPFRRSRCLLPAVGWYEWQEGELVKGRRQKLPFYLTLASGELAGLAGLLSAWTDPGTGEVLLTCAILTRPPSPSAAVVHDRMPVILAKQAQAEWLDPGVNDAARVAEIIRDGALGDVRHHRVSTAVNRASAEGAGLVEAIDAGTGA